MKENFIKVIQFLVENTNLGIFLIAALTFGITLANFYRNRASIKVTQLLGSQSMLIKPDFIDTKTPDVYWHNDYRLIADVIITNQSAKPISIVEFVLNDKMKFNSYHLTGRLYVVTISPESSTHNGVTISRESKVLNYPIDDLWLRPIINLPPYTSVRGFLFFHFSDKNMVKLGENKLEIITSRKTFIKRLDLYEFQNSVLSLPKEIHTARDRHF